MIVVIEIGGIQRARRCRHTSFCLSIDSTSAALRLRGHFGQSPHVLHKVDQGHTALSGGTRV